MGLEKKLAQSILITGISLGSLLINPNYEARDFREPHRYVQKFDYGRGYEHSGTVYSLSAGVFAAGVLGIAYHLLRRKDSRNT